MTGDSRILLVHLVSNGDCLMATTIARQIKTDYPGCHLTWAISDKCRQVIENNPFVDEIWSVAHAPGESLHEDVWPRTKAEAERRRRAGELDRIFTTQLYPENYDNFDGTTRSSIFRSYPRPITVPVQPVLRLFEPEIENVERFCLEHKLASYRDVVLFECTPSSNQSSLSHPLAIRVASRIVRARPDTAIVISSHLPFASDHPAVIDASRLTYRENAQLSKHCTALLGCSSGITWLTTSTAGKTLPTLQFLRDSESWYGFASVKYDHEHFGLDATQIVETDLVGEDEITDAVARFLAEGVRAGIRERRFVPSVEQLYGLYRERHGDLDTRRVLRNFVERNPAVRVNEAAFYAGLLRIEVRWRAGKLLRGTVAATRRLRAALHPDDPRNRS